jgi:hypothetical protein
VSQELGDEPTRARLLGAVERHAAVERFEVFSTWAAVLRHWTLARRGDRLGLNAMAATIRDIADTRGAPLTPYFLALLARASLAAGETRQGLKAVTTALLDVQRTGARYMESELQRLRGELLMTSGADPADIGTALSRAHETACRQYATTLERRAAEDLARWRPTPR